MWSQVTFCLPPFLDQSISSCAPWGKRKENCWIFNITYINKKRSWQSSIQGIYFCSFSLCTWHFPDLPQVQTLSCTPSSGLPTHFQSVYKCTLQDADPCSVFWSYTSLFEFLSSAFKTVGPGTLYIAGYLFPLDLLPAYTLKDLSPTKTHNTDTGFSQSISGKSKLNWLKLIS